MMRLVHYSGSGDVLAFNASIDDANLQRAEVQVIDNMVMLMTLESGRRVPIR